MVVYPVVALDGDKEQVDSVASNMGHLLWTGILSPEEAALVAERLTGPDMASGYGLRTLSSEAVAYNPLSYHCGSVWPHDTAIAIDGLARTGAGATAGHLLHGLVAAGDNFGHRLPELFGGEQRTDGSRPLPYPSACSPQAWAAGAALLALRAILGIEPDLPNGVLHLRPMEPFPFGHLVVEGMPLAGERSASHWRTACSTCSSRPPMSRWSCTADDDGERRVGTSTRACPRRRAGEEIRTPGLSLTRGLLYQLSYSSERPPRGRPGRVASRHRGADTLRGFHRTRGGPAGGDA